MKKISIILCLACLSLNFLFSKQDSLIAYWSFEDSTAKDFSGNGYHGVMVNNPKPIAGIKNGTGMYFTGKGYYIVVGTDIKQIGDHILLPRINFESLESFTISMWVYEESMSHFHGDAYILFGNWSTGWLGITHAAPLPDTTSNINFTVAGREMTNCLKIPFNYGNRYKWMYYCMVYKNNRLDAYINGDYVGSISQLINISENTQALGRHWWYYSGEYRTSARFTGIIDEVKIFSKALTESEIKDEYKSAFFQISSDTTKLCEGDTLLLTASDGYSSYLWSTGEKNRSIKVTKNGFYYLTAVSSTGIELKGTYEVKNFIKRDIEISGLDNNNHLSFNKVLKDGLNCKKILILNKEPDELRIKRIRLSGNVSFSIPLSQLPLVILPNSSKYLEVCFSPDNEYNVKDTLILSDSCFQKVIYLEGLYQLNNFYGASKCDVMIRANETNDTAEIIVSNLFPNPSNDFLNFTIESNATDIMINTSQLKIYNTFGSEVSLSDDQIMISKSLNQLFIKIEVKKFGIGPYVIVLNNNSEIFPLKFIISP